jgi:hypothetical protein
MIADAIPFPYDALLIFGFARREATDYCGPQNH